MHPYDDLEAAWKALRTTRGVRVREVACVGAPRTLLLAELGDHTSPEIALAAGVHGDEPAGPWALLALVRENLLDPQYAYRIWACTNPSGYRARTRENAEGADINRSFGRGGQTPEARAVLTANRDRTFVLSFDLHEDTGAHGFYCYEYGGNVYGRAAIAALDTARLPVDPMTEHADASVAGPLDPAAVVLERGRIVPSIEAERAAIGGLSYSLALARRAASAALTFETPTNLAWEVRVTMHVTAVRAAIAALER